MFKSLIIAHRGASAYAPENTLAAFKKAINLGADGIELDVHLTKDGHIIVCHDESVERTTDGTGYIKDLTLSEIKSLDAGTWFNKEFVGERLPTLEEVFEVIKNNEILVNIELKNGIIPYIGLEEKVVELIDQYNIRKRTIISSFNHHSLIKVKNLSDISTGALYVSNIANPWIYAKSLKAEAIHPNYYTVSKELVEKCAKNSIIINTYTVNGENDIKAIAETGVNGIITNYPDIGRRIVDNLVR